MYSLRSNSSSLLRNSDTLLLPASDTGRSKSQLLSTEQRAVKSFILSLSHPISSATAAISAAVLISRAAKEATAEANCSELPGFLVPLRMRKMADVS